MRAEILLVQEVRERSGRWRADGLMHGLGKSAMLFPEEGGKPRASLATGSAKQSSRVGGGIN